MPHSINCYMLAVQTPNQHPDSNSSTTNSRKSIVHSYEYGEKITCNNFYLDLGKIEANGGLLMTDEMVFFNELCGRRVQSEGVEIQRLRSNAKKV
uniref:Uncharacterized protein n=1 Tax=Tanacetum cinerariifolium TaxID=118510 RepID=A0A6L2LVY6_TANCI|nr:hypothetical protein [Tanacetum cinerariifolium]